MPQGIPRKRIGDTLVFLGVMAWVPYFYLKLFTEQEVSVTPFLAAHLSGVVPGFVLRRWESLRALADRFLGQGLGKPRS